MSVVGTSHFVNFTKACDYYRNEGNDELTPAQLETLVREKIADGSIALGKPEIEVGQTLLLTDDNTRYAIRHAN
jgi:hypothetical protein